MTGLSPADEKTLYIALAVLTAAILAVLLRRVLGLAVKITARTVLGGGLLAVLAPFGEVLGLHLGVNLWNALVIGVLGLPGLGLLMLLNWLTG